MESIDPIIKREEENGIRLSFNLIPTNRVDSIMCSCPIGCLYTPLKKLPDLDGKERVPLPYEPYSCQKCNAILNSFAQVNFSNHIWCCPFCLMNNPLPSSYSSIQPGLLPLELHPDATTVEYMGRNTAVKAPVFILVVDICNLEKEHKKLIDVLLQTVAALPPNAIVGMITFGSCIQVYEMCPSDIPRSFIFSGNRAFNAGELSKMIKVERDASGMAKGKILMPMEVAETTLSSIIDKLEINKIPRGIGQRHRRCAGAAIHLAIRLIEIFFPLAGGQVFVFNSGPVTKGPGTIATISKAEQIRQHSDIENGKADISIKAEQFFNEIGEIAASKNIIINYFSASFEESGLHEIQSCVLKTGGWILSAETWGDENIHKSILKYFQKIFPNSGTEVTIKVVCSPDFKISGCIGPCHSKNVKDSHVSDSVVGIGGTSQWSISGVMPSTTLCFFFNIFASKDKSVPTGQGASIQFITQFRHLATGTYRTRVTTSTFQFHDLTSFRSQIGCSFDQEAGTVMIARLAMWKLRNEKFNDALHYVDRTLIRFCRAFATHNHGNNKNFGLRDNFSLLPMFIYHFRRSPFMSSYNMSPDNSTSLRHFLLMEDTMNSLLMIQPSLTQYDADKTSKQVLLDMSSLQPRKVLLLDTFFSVVIWYGADVVSWRDQKLDNDPQYENIKWLLEQPMRDAEAIIADRFPEPLFITCDQDSSLARHLVARCNPSIQRIDNSGNIYTDSLAEVDEPSYEKFEKKLIEIALNN